MESILKWLITLKQEDIRNVSYTPRFSLNIRCTAHERFFRSLSSIISPRELRRYHDVAISISTSLPRSLSRALVIPTLIVPLCHFYHVCHLLYVYGNIWQCTYCYIWNIIFVPFLYETVISRFWNTLYSAEEISQHRTRSQDTRKLQCPNTTEESI